jgi:hypothetical protein
VPTVASRTRRRQESTRKADEDKKENGGAASKGKPQAKEAKKAKRRRLGIDPEDTGDEELAQSHFLSAKRAQRAPGQIDNCVECGVRFTVTPYTNAAPEDAYPDGGLLCAKCAKGVIGSKKLNGRSTVSREKRRQIQRNLLDGYKQRGAKSLLQICIEVSICIFSTAHYLVSATSYPTLRVLAPTRVLMFTIFILLLCLPFCLERVPSIPLPARQSPVSFFQKHRLEEAISPRPRNFTTEVSLTGNRKWPSILIRLMISGICRLRF